MLSGGRTPTPFFSCCLVQPHKCLQWSQLLPCAESSWACILINTELPHLTGIIGDHASRVRDMSAISGRPYLLGMLLCALFKRFRELFRSQRGERLGQKVNSSTLPQYLCIGGEKVLEGLTYVFQTWGQFSSLRNGQLLFLSMIFSKRKR